MSRNMEILAPLAAATCDRPDYLDEDQPYVPGFYAGNLPTMAELARRKRERREAEDEEE